MDENDPTKRAGGDGASATDAGGAEEHAVYVISVAAELAGVHPQTLRIYDRLGLVVPKRTQGNNRRYSARDVARLRLIQELTQEGVNLAGVKMIMDLQRQIDELDARLELMRRQLEQRRAISMPGRRVTGEIVPLRTLLQFRFPWEDGRR